MKKSTKLWYSTGILLLFNVLILSTKLGGDTLLLYISDILPVITALVAVVCVFIAFQKFRKFDFAKTAWLFILIGIILNFFAETSWGYLELVLEKDMDDYFPNFADYFWCIAYPFFFAGLIMMLYGYKKSGFPMGKPRAYVFITSLIVVVSLFIVFLLIIPIINDSETDAKSKVFSTIYPFGDLVVVALASILMYITNLFGRNSISQPWRYITFGFIAFTVADLIYTYLSWHDLYNGGNFIDVAWNFGYLMIALAGVYQIELMESLKEKNYDNI